ncbi:MAG: AMP-binding protein, partial [Myxococcota bacterium]
MTSHDSVVDLLRTRADDTADTGGYTFLNDGRAGSVSLTFAELDRRARAIGAALQARGAAGERVLLLYPPGLEYVAGFFGCLYAGAIAVPVYPPRPDKPLTRFLSILDDARPRFALATTPIEQLGRALLGSHPLDWLATDTVDPGLADGWSPPALDRRAVAFLQYTSGSTADPKGVRVTHGNLLHNEAAIQGAFGTDRDSVIVGWLPLYHDMGLIGNVLQPLWLGGRCVLLSPLEFLRDPLRWLEAVSEHRGVVSGGPNFAFDLCVRKVTPRALASLDLSSWRVAFNGAEPIRPDTMRRFAETFAPCGFAPDAFLPCYGLAEGTLLVSAGRDPRPHWFSTPALERRRVEPTEAGASDGRELSQSGTFAPGSVWIVDPETRVPAALGAVGEIWVRSDSVADGYWNKPELSAATFAATTADTGEGPFLRTGDLGFVRDGALFVTGRSKDLLILRGRNHYPQDLERTAELAHPALRLGCSAAFAIDRDGEERAVVAIEVGRPPEDPGAVVEAIRAAVAADHDVALDAVILLAPRSLPKTSSGKVQRRACRAAWQAGELAVVHQALLAGVAGPHASAANANVAPDVANANVARTPVTPTRPTGADPGATDPGATDPCATDPGATDPGATDPGVTEVHRFVLAELAARAGVPEATVSLDTPVGRFALDSLQRVELAGAIEQRFRVKVPL